MIRRPDGDSFLLFTQHDHALLAGELAARLGNSRFDGPDPRPATLAGISLHDAGWPLHDDAPTLNRRGHPLHVFETPLELSTRIWHESARHAAEHDPYAGLLVSLHVLTLSSMMVPSTMSPVERYEKRHDVFLINQFQQNEIERQEQLRPRLGLSIDRPLNLGLATAGANPEEDRLRFNVAWLRAMDAISLDVCCGKRAFDRLPQVYSRVGGTPVELQLSHPAPDVMKIDPWPFAGSRIELCIAARRVPATPFPHVELFRQAYAAAPVQQRRVVFV